MVRAGREIQEIRIVSQIRAFFLFKGAARIRPVGVDRTEAETRPLHLPKKRTKAMAASQAAPENFAPARRDWGAGRKIGKAAPDLAASSAVRAVGTGWKAAVFEKPLQLHPAGSGLPVFFSRGPSFHLQKDPASVAKQLQDVDLPGARGGRSVPRGFSFEQQEVAQQKSDGETGIVDGEPHPSRQAGTSRTILPAAPNGEPLARQSSETSNPGFQRGVFISASDARTYMGALEAGSSESPEENLRYARSPTKAARVAWKGPGAATAMSPNTSVKSSR